MAVLIEYSHAKDLDKENRYMNPLPHDLPKFEYIAAPTQKYALRKNVCNDKRLIDESYFYENQDNIPSSVPEELNELYEGLLDFYSTTELESFRQEYGNQIIPQLYREVLDSYYG